MLPIAYDRPLILAMHAITSVQAESSNQSALPDSSDARKSYNILACMHNAIVAAAIYASVCGEQLVESKSHIVPISPLCPLPGNQRHQST